MNSSIVDGNNERLAVRWLIFLFRKLSSKVTAYPWWFIITICLLTLLCSSSICFTKMTNDVTDFTPYAARARIEQEVYEDFFARKGEHITIFIFVTSKNGHSMLGVPRLNETVRILDHVLYDINLHDEETNNSFTFNQMCTSFCEINEPVRGFYNGLQLRESSNTSSLIDLSYPRTKIFGIDMRIDNSFYGVEVEISRENGKKELISLKNSQLFNAKKIFDNENTKIKNNLRDIKMVMLQFRASKPATVIKEELERYEMDVVNFFKKNFSAQYVDLVVMTPSYSTSEVVRSGMLLFPYLIIGFIIMCSFSMLSTSISAMMMDQMVPSKFVEAIMACVCPIMACASGLGLLFWFGFRFGSTLCVTPFLVLAIGVDDAFLMINSWQYKISSLRSNQSMYFNRSSRIIVASTICSVLEDTGPSITITTLTNVLAFFVGAITPTPEIRLFCLGNAITMAFDFIYQITFFTAIMVISQRNSNNDVFQGASTQLYKNRKNSKRKLCQTILEKSVSKYCSFLCHKITTFIIIMCLIIYWIISIYGITTMRVEMNPLNVISKDSDIVKVFKLRKEYILPYRSTSIVIVRNPGKLDDAMNLRLLNALAEDFERLSSSLGRFATNFWLRDFEEFIRLSDQPAYDDGYNSTGGVVSHHSEIMKDLLKFLQWPEFRHWKGFLDIIVNESGDVHLNKYMFSIASHGEELNVWVNRAILLKNLRDIADKYTRLNVSIYEDDAKFLDLIETLPSHTLQTSLCTLISMMFICALFIKQLYGIMAAIISIASTFIGICGFLSLWGMNLDPILMTALTMSIGFSVDIPSHITYHYCKNSSLHHEVRLHQCLSEISFPVLQAALSTFLCVLSLLSTDLYLSEVFFKTMTLVVANGLIHGILILPVIFNMIHLLQVSRNSFLSSTVNINDKVCI